MLSDWEGNKGKRRADKICKLREPKYARSKSKAKQEIIEVA